MVQERYSRCLSCVRKGIHCDGTFPQEEFENLEREKSELLEKSRRSRDLLVYLANQMLEAGKEYMDLEKRLKTISQRERQIIGQEAQLLGGMTSGEAFSEDHDAHESVSSSLFPDWGELSFDVGDIGEQVSG
jgi:hypothetical protein